MSVSEKQTPSGEGPQLAALSSPASAILLRALGPSLRSVRLVGLLGCNHFSRICRLVTAATKTIPPRAYSITKGSRELFSCLSAASAGGFVQTFRNKYRYVSQDL